MVGWYSAYCTRNVRVTLTYADILIRGGEGGRVVIRVRYAYCQSYYDLHGYSDKGKGRWYSVYCTRTVRVQICEGGRMVIHVLYTLCQSYSGVHGGQLT